MNNSLRRFCNSRARLVHRSKGLVLTDKPVDGGVLVRLFDENGHFDPRWRSVDRGKVNGRNNGATFAAGIQNLKRIRAERGGGLSCFELQRIKRAAWHAGSNK